MPLVWNMPKAQNKMHEKLKFRFMYSYTYHIGKKCRHQHDTCRRANFVQSLFLCRFRGYLVRYNVGIWRTIHLYEWPHDSFEQFSLPESLKIIIKLVYPEIHTLLPDVHPCLHNVWSDSLHVRVRSIPPLRDSDMDVL